jgi:hypothetical protein
LWYLLSFILSLSWHVKCIIALCTVVVTYKSIYFNHNVVIVNTNRNTKDLLFKSPKSNRNITLSEQFKNPKEISHCWNSSKIQWKYHTVGTVQKISHFRNSSKSNRNVTLLEQFQNPIEKSHKDNRYTKHTLVCLIFKIRTFFITTFFAWLFVRICILPICDKTCMTASFYYAGKFGPIKLVWRLHILLESLFEDRKSTY